MSSKMALSDIEKDWGARGYSCAIWTDPPGQVWRDYVHATDELLMLIEGEIELAFQGKILHPTVGEEVFIPAGVSHTVRNSGKTRNQWYYGYKWTSTRSP